MLVRNNHNLTARKHECKLHLHKFHETSKAMQCLMIREIKYSPNNF